MLATPPEWLVVVPDPPVDPSLLSTLDPGETAAISLALAAGPPSLLLIDERKGRRMAESLGLRSAGTINIIAEAAVNGLLDYQETIALIRTTTNFRVHDNVVEKAWDKAR